MEENHMKSGLFEVGQQGKRRKRKGEQRTDGRQT